jgi:hypothetical protein
MIRSPPEAEPLLDRGLMLSCLALSSSEVVRAAAAAWLEAYDAARAAGAPASVAEQRAAAAWEASRGETRRQLGGALHGLVAPAEGDASG